MHLFIFGIVLLFLAIVGGAGYLIYKSIRKERNTEERTKK